MIGVGGFLGIGEKDVAVGFDRVSWSDRDGQRIIVVSATKEDLQAAPEFQRTAIMDGVAATGPEDESTTPPVIADEAAEAMPPATGTTPQMSDPDIVPPVDPATTAATPPDEMRLVDPALISAEKAHRHRGEGRRRYQGRRDRRRSSR